MKGAMQLMMENWRSTPKRVREHLTPVKLRIYAMGFVSEAEPHVFFETDGSLKRPALMVALARECPANTAEEFDEAIDELADFLGVKA